MARYHGSVCRFCRREGAKLFLKGERCYSNKCAFERRNYPPGQHGQYRSKYSDYGHQLRAKQKIIRTYGLLERQFRKTFAEADRIKGVTGENLIILLESRLDNIIYRLGFACSRREARQLVRHGHFLVNEKKVNIPSYRVKPGDEVTVKEKSKKVSTILGALEAATHRGVPSWLELDKENFRGVIKSLPLREEITTPMDENLVVEFYSK